MRCPNMVPPYGSHFLMTVRDMRRGIPAATLTMPIKVRGAKDLASFRFGHAVFRCMDDGWPQQHHNSNGDNTHIQNRVHGSNNACAMAPVILSQHGSATRKRTC